MGNKGIKKKFRKVDPAIWNDAKFNSMSHEGKLAFLFLLTHPNLTAAGAMRGTKEGLAVELKLLPKQFGEPFAKGMVKVDPEANLIWLPRFINYNKPENPNMAKAMGKAMYYLPECSMKNEIIQSVKQLLEPFGERFAKLFAEGLGESKS